MFLHASLSSVVCINYETYEDYTVLRSCGAYKPDCCSSIITILFRRTRVGSLKDITLVVNSSAQCHFSQIVSTTDGTTMFLASTGLTSLLLI